MVERELRISQVCKEEEFSPTEQYQKELSSHVTAIQKRFDQKIAESIGFDGNIFDAFKESLQLKNNKADNLAIDRTKFPSELETYVVSDMYPQYRRNSGKPTIIFHDKKQELNYYIRFESLEDTEISLSKIEVDSQIDVASLAFRKLGEQKLLSEAVIHDYYNVATINEPTKRTVGFLDTSDPSVSMRIGQERNGIKIEPLIYGDISNDGKATLLVHQGIYTSLGRPEHVDWNEEENEFAVEIRNEKFYFPIATNPHSELIRVAQHLGI